MGKQFVFWEIVPTLTGFVSYNPFLRSYQIGVAVGFSDPVFRSHFKDRHGIEVEDNMHTAVAEWTTIAIPVITTDGKISSFCKSSGFRRKDVFSGSPLHI